MYNNNIQKYLEGKGIETSTTHSKKSLQFIKLEYSNYYRLYPKVQFESLDFIYNKNSINATKFYPILLQEWSYYIKPRGHLILEFEDNGLLNGKSLYNSLKLILKDKIKIIEYEKKGRYNLFILEKTKKSYDNSSIDEWTCGIITKGERDNFIDKYIESVRIQKIPKYEIIVCGTYGGKYIKSKDVKYIHFNKKDNLGWITKKKNLICASAKYENIVIVHDRYYLDKKFYEGCKRYGSYFDFVIPQSYDPDGILLGTHGTSGRLFRIRAIIAPGDYDKNIICSGGIVVLKKSVWKKCKFDEFYFWNEEDTSFGIEATKRGYYARINPLSKAITFRSYKSIQSPYYEFNNKKLGRFRLRFFKHNKDYPDWKTIFQFYITNIFEHTMDYRNYVRFMRWKSKIFKLRSEYDKSKKYYSRYKVKK
jgi:hypothetical protein